MKIYVVMGICGQYSDRTEWTVAAYKDREMADAHADKASKISMAYYKGLESRYVYNQDDLKEKLGEVDPNACVDYTGTDWFVLEVPFLDKVP